MRTPLAIVASAALVAPASAQNQPTSDGDAGAPVSVKAEIGPGWTLQFEPAAHFIAPAGDIRLPNSGGLETGEIDLDTLNIDSPRLSPFGELHIARGKWRISATGFWTSQDDRVARIETPVQVGDLALNAGDRVSSSLDFGTFEGTASYRVLDKRSRTNARGRTAASAGVDIIGGVRFFDVDFDIEGPGGSDGASHLWAQPVVGARLELEFDERFGIDAASTFGYLPAGDNESFSWDITVGLSWRPVENLGVQIGYQMLAFNLKDGDDAEAFEWDGSLAGLYFGAVLRF